MKAAFHTLGCKTNSYETQAIKEQFEQAGFEIADFTEWADVYIINTCSVTAVAAQKSRQMLHRCKKNNPDAMVVACGCYAQEAGERLLESGVDLVVGNNEKSKIVELVSSCFNTEGRKVLLDDLMHCTSYEAQTITNAGTHVRAYVKIQDGCNRFCSYCIIPYLRGRSRSRAPEEILAEVKTLAEAGIQEIVLTGIDISDYRTPSHNADIEAASGPSASPQKQGTNALADLIFEIEKIEGIQRIRLGSLEAGVITPDFLKQIMSSQKLCPHFHLSLQSGCDATLKRMNRDYTTAEFVESLHMIRECFEHPAITTDVIAGFAGETEEEFKETQRFVEEAAFSELHVFPYSRRKGTRADKMPGQLTRAEKAKRTAELISIGKELQRHYMEQFIGKEVEVLTEEEVTIEGQKYLVGFTPEYIKTAIKIGSSSEPVKPAIQVGMSSEPVKTATKSAEPENGDIGVNKIVTISPERIIEFRNELILAQIKHDI